MEKYQKRIKWTKMLAAVSAVAITASAASFVLTSCSSSIEEQAASQKDSYIKAENTILDKVVEKLNFTKKENAPAMKDALALVNAANFDIYNNTVFKVSHQIDHQMFDVKVHASLLSDIAIQITITIKSKQYPDNVFQEKLVTIYDHTDQDVTDETNTLNSLIVNLKMDRSSSAYTADQAIVKVLNGSFNPLNNDVFTLTQTTGIEHFSITVKAEKVNETTIKITLAFTSKKFSWVTGNKEFTLTGFTDAVEIDKANELTAINAFLSPITMTRTSTTMTADQAVAKIAASGFNFASNDVFVAAGAVNAGNYNITTSAVKINELSITVTLKVTSKKYSSVFNSKNYTLANFIEGSVDEANKIKAVVAKMVMTKITNTQTVDQAVTLIKTTGFDIYSNTVFTLTPAAEIKVYNTSVTASKINDTDINVMITLTSKIYPSVNQVSTSKLTGFTYTSGDGVSGTGISKVWHDSDVGTVYIGTANSYTMSGKTFYGDDYSQLNPFQDYGAEELDLMTKDATWPQIKQLVASSRPVSGIPNMNIYLPIGTPITFTDAVKNHASIPSNVKRFISIIDEPKYDDMFYYRNSVFTYRDLITAIAKYPRILAEVNLDASYIKNNANLKGKDGLLSPEKALAYVAKLEIASMFAHFTQETGGGYGNEKITKNKQIPWNSNYDKNYVAPSPDHTNAQLITAAKSYGITLANEAAMNANPSAKIMGPEKQALFYVSEAAYPDDTSEVARTAYTVWNLKSAPWTAAAFPPPIGADGKSTVSYIGRGAKQLSYNYNYAPASRVFFGDDEADVLLNNPSRVAKEGWLAIGTAIMFYMTPSGNKPSMHDAITGAWEPTAKQQIDYKWKPGFGMSTNLINGGVELKGDGVEANQTPQAISRQAYYAMTIKELGIFNFATSEFFDNAGYSQTTFDKATVTKMNTDWTFSWEGAATPTLVTWDTGAGFKINFPGDYYRTEKAFKNSKFIETWKIDMQGNPDTKDKAFAVKAADWSAGKNPTYTKVGAGYDWFNK